MLAFWSRNRFCSDSILISIKGGPAIDSALAHCRNYFLTKKKKRRIIFIHFQGKDSLGENKRANCCWLDPGETPECGIIQFRVGKSDPGQEF